MTERKVMRKKNKKTSASTAADIFVDRFAEIILRQVMDIDNPALDPKEGWFKEH